MQKESSTGMLVSSLNHEDRETGRLLRFLQENNFRVVIIEGPRGVGKTTLSDELLKYTSLVYYKTWGREQKWLRHTMSSDYGLDLPQGTYFVLDFIKQVPLAQPVLADRGNISALAYQRELPIGNNRDLHKYYVDLMRDTHSVLLYLTGPEDVILSRRVSREREDEFSLHTMNNAEALHRVKSDSELYEDSIRRMTSAGLVSLDEFDLGEGCVCWAYIPKGMDAKPVED